MGSTNFNAPPLKLILTVIGTVVVLHVLTAMALAMATVKTTAPVIKPPKITPPIEIQLVAPPVEIEEPEMKIEAMAPVKELKQQPKPTVATDLKPKPQPQAVKKSQPVAKTKPPVKAPVTSAPKNITPKPNTQPDTAKVVKNEPFSHEVKRQELMSTVQAEALAAINERKILAAQTEKYAEEAHARAVRDAQAAADAKAVREAAAADAQAAKEAEAAKEAAKVAIRAKAAAAASNTPVDFDASNANWASQPNFSFPSRAKRGTRAGDTFNVVLVLQVNKQGGIDSVRLAQSSGNAILDREAQRQVRSGKFRPFMKNDVPVVGNVTLPISYAVP